MRVTTSAKLWPPFSECFGIVIHRSVKAYIGLLRILAASVQTLRLSSELSILETQRQKVKLSATPIQTTQLELIAVSSI